MLTGAQLEGLTRRFRRQLEIIAARTENAVTGAWDALSDYDDRRIEQYTKRVAPVTTAAKSSAVAVGVGYYATVTQRRPPSVAVKSIATAFDPRGAFVAYWNALGNNRPWSEAVQAGKNRAASTASGLVVSSARLTGDHVLPDVKWTRVASGDACAFCQDAAGGTYASAESADFGHERCSCSIVPA